MGFPVCYSEMLLPRLLLQVLLLLGHLHRFLLWAFQAVGLGDLIDLGANPPAPAHELRWQEEHGQGELQWPSSLQHRRPEFRALPAVAIDEALPVLRFAELVASSSPAGLCGGGDCAVCLSGIGGEEEVRRLGNCRHVFHRGCLDRWMAHDQRTCPLCRAPLVAGEVAGALWAASAGLPDAADYDLSYPSPLPLAPTPTLLRPHELLLNGLGGFQ